MAGSFIGSSLGKNLGGALLGGAMGLYGSTNKPSYYYVDTNYLGNGLASSSLNTAVNQGYVNPFEASVLLSSVFNPQEGGITGNANTNTVPSQYNFLSNPNWRNEGKMSYDLPTKQYDFGQMFNKVFGSSNSTPSQYRFLSNNL